MTTDKKMPEKRRKKERVRNMQDDFILLVCTLNFELREEQVEGHVYIDEMNDKYRGTIERNRDRMNMYCKEFRSFLFFRSSYVQLTQTLEQQMTFST